MIVVTTEQRTPEWAAAKRGMPSASEMGGIIQPVKLGYAKPAAKTYINRLIDEVKRPEAYGVDSWKGNLHTRRGTALEPDAIGTYAFDHGVRVKSTGFVLSDCRRFGCSPDGLVGSDGMVEAKSPDGHTFVEWFLEHAETGDVPSEHKAQVHGSLIITGRAWCDFIAYCPGYETLVIRVTPNDFTAKLRTHLDTFHEQYTAALAVFGLQHPGLSYALESAA